MKKIILSLSTLLILLVSFAGCSIDALLGKTAENLTTTVWVSDAKYITGDNFEIKTTLTINPVDKSVKMVTTSSDTNQYGEKATDYVETGYYDEGETYDFQFHLKKEGDETYRNPMTAKIDSNSKGKFIKLDKVIYNYFYNNETPETQYTYMTVYLQK